jgi:hypothetical protein
VFAIALVDPFAFSTLANAIFQIYAIFMVRSNSSLCTAKLMTDPLTQQRLATMHELLGVLLFLSPASSAGEVAAQRWAACTLTLTLTLTRGHLE